MIRLIHTADLHLDLCYAGAGGAAFGVRRRQGLRDAMQRIVRRAMDWPAHALLIAGDLFEHDRVSRDTIAMLCGLFESASNVSIFIAPGNHDPYVPSSPYATEDWPSNVVIFQTPAWTARDTPHVPLTVHGFAFDGPDISSNPFGCLRIPEDDRIHVAIGHGSEMGSLPAGKGAYAPFNAQDAVCDGLSYLALGHYHAMKHIPGNFETRVQYSGSPEGHDFGEPGPHYFLEVEIAPDSVDVRPVQSSRVVYLNETIDCTRFESSQQIVEAVRGLSAMDAAARIARVTLKGSVPADLEYQLDSIQEAIAREFEYLEIVNATEPADDYDFLSRERTSLGAFIARINAELRDTRDEPRIRMLHRAREVGLAAYRGRSLTVRGVDKE